MKTQFKAPGLVISSILWPAVLWNKHSQYGKKKKKRLKYHLLISSTSQWRLENEIWINLSFCSSEESRKKDRENSMVDFLHLAILLLINNRHSLLVLGPHNVLRRLRPSLQLNSPICVRTKGNLYISETNSPEVFLHVTSVCTSLQAPLKSCE